MRLPWKKIFPYAIILVVFYFLGMAVIRNWHEVRSYAFEFNVELAVLSVVIFITSYCFPPLIWRTIIKIVHPENRLSAFQAIRISIISEMTKYIPGGVWTYLSKIYMGRKSGTSGVDLLIATAIDTGVMLVTALSVGLAALLFAVTGNVSGVFISSLALIAAGLLFLHPRIFYFFLNRALRISGRDTVSEGRRLKYNEVMRFSVFYLPVLTLNATGFYALSISIAPVLSSHFALVVAAFLLSGALSIAAVIAPSGLGIREGVMASILQIAVPLPVAILISILARFWAIMCETILLVAVAFLGRFWSHREQSEQAVLDQP